ncbi:hypothetical protein [Paraburkholderia caledonica]|uniref:hypothetical protein n=1 Tax=Paraburkholderia caledonica TaxID=134536 RepID=UPI0013DEC764|nr:hypothetical protein [Paraburkholderia caledonica]
MTRKVPTLSVEDRVRAAVHAKRCSDPAIKVSISEVCRLAGVSRAGLYAHHRPLIEELLHDVRASGAESKTTVNRAEQKPDIEATNRALLYLCLELQLELKSMRARCTPRTKAKST